MLKLLWVYLFALNTVLASDNDLQKDDLDKDPRFLLPLLHVKRYEGRPYEATMPYGGSPAGRCSARLENALDQLKRRKRAKPKALEDPSQLDLSGYSLYQHLRSAPVDMYVTRMRVRLPQNNNWVRVEKCFFDPRNVSLDTMLLFHDLTISGNVDLYDANNLDRAPENRRQSREFDPDPKRSLYPNDRPFNRGNGHNGCNMILRLRKAGIGFHTRPLTQMPGKFNIKTDSEFVEPGFISVYAYGCEKYINRNRDAPRSRRRRSDEFTFNSEYLDEVPGARNTDTWDTYEAVGGQRMNYERSKLFRPDDQLDEAEDISREMEDIFTKGIRTLLTTYMKKELQPAIKETLMRNMGYVISYGK